MWKQNKKHKRNNLNESYPRHPEGFRREGHRQERAHRHVRDVGRDEGPEGRPIRGRGQNSLQGMYFVYLYMCARKAPTYLPHSEKEPHLAATSCTRAVTTVSG